MWEQEQVDEMSKNSGELLWVHYKLGHLSFTKISFMATVGLLDKRLSNCNVPKFAGCMYGKASRCAWRVKGAVNQILKSKAPGEVVFIDQLTVSMPGLIRQIRGFSSHAKYHYATVILDHFSDCPYIMMQKVLMGEETIRAKANYEGHVCRHGVIVKHNHTNNGIFTGGAFQEDVRAQRQTMSYCGVGVHHQNGHVEKLFRDLQDHGRTVLLHTQQRWLDAISENIWPYAFALCAEIRKWTPRSADGKIPYHLFCRTELEKNLLKTPAYFWMPCLCPRQELTKCFQAKQVNELK